MGLRFVVMSKVLLSFLLLLAIAGNAGAQTAGATAGQGPQPVPAPDLTKQALVFESSHVKVTYQEDGSDVREQTAVVKVLSQAGVQGLAVLTFDYTSANETVEFDYVRVRKPDGTVVVTPDYNVQDMPADVTRNAPMYSDVHEKHVTVKALGVGDTLEYLVRYRTSKPQVPGQFWYAYNFRKDVVIKDEQLFIDTPRDKYVKVASPDLAPVIQEENGRKIYTWKTSNLEIKEPAKTPPSMQQSNKKTPSVLLTTFHSWEEVGRWYGELARSQVFVTPQIQAKAAELTKGLNGDDEKMRALYDFVSTHYHYVSLSFGIGRYQPHPAEDVLENEYGDCKDKHTLIAALLKAAGFDAWPALINASNLDVNADVPSPGQFDHVITVVPHNGDMIWLDTTPGVTPFAMLMANLRHKQALVMPTDKPALLIYTPQNPPFPSVQTFTAKGKLNGDGTYTAHMQATAFGDTGAVERYVFEQYSPAQWKDVLQQTSYRWGFAGDVSAVDISDLADINKPLVLAYDYKREKFGDWDNHRISMPLPPTGLEGAEDSKEPEQPVFLGAIGSLSYEAQIQLPSGYTATLPSNLSLSEDFADFRATYEAKDGMLTVTRTVTIKKSEVPITAWARYQKFSKAIGDDHGSWITLSNGKEENAASESANPEATREFINGTDAMQRHDLTRASESFSRVLELDPKFPGAHGNLGLTYLSSGSTDAGIRELKKEEELHPDETIPYQTLARVYAMKHDKDEAIAQLQKVMQIDPKNRDAALNLGQLLSGEKKYPEALAVLQKAAEFAPDSGTIQYELGYAYIRSGNKEKGLEVLQAALKNDQQRDRDTMALNNVAYSLIEMDTGMDVAQQYAEKSLEQEEAASLKASSDRDALATTSGLDAIWDTVGWIYYKQGQYEKALPYIKAAWLLGQEAEVGDHLGQTYAKLGKREDADRTYRLAYAANSQGPRTTYRNGIADKIDSHFKELTGKTLAESVLVHAKGHGGATPETGMGVLSHMREVKITNTSHAPASGTFTIVLSQGKVDDVKQVDGDESLKPLTDRIKAAKFDVELPGTAPVKVTRRGIVSCGSLGCDMALIPVHDQSLFAGE
jgi:tetratricopeptide (TPR) repeat protein/transglutaminase-like putative cysteine protease